MLTLPGTYFQGFGGAGAAPIVMMVAIFAIFYFLLIMPQQRKQKKWAEMLTKIKPGDRVVTSGGIAGIVMSAKDDTLVLRVAPDNIKIEVVRSSVVTLTTNEDEKQLKS
ncbi:MAG TPA: preprotein translocase subunit YajC [Candidatus Angelobacter sp.]|nr:preprotein translocase subunit YajC [Candidatus Angelobacter sp.]